MQIITFANLKGGVGKTMLTYNIGGFLASKGFKVLMIDCDTQANLTENCGMSHIFNEGYVDFDKEDDWDDLSKFGQGFSFSEHDKNKNLAHALAYGASPQDVIRKVAKVIDGKSDETKTVQNLYLIPSQLNLVSLENVLSRFMPSATHKALDKWIKRYRPALEKNFDYILLDVSPSLTTETTNALYVSDDIVLISDLSTNSYIGMKNLYQAWTKTCEGLERPFNISGVIINRYDTKAKSFSQKNENLIRNFLVSKHLTIFKNVIHNSIPIRTTEVTYPIAYTNNNKIINSPAYKSFLDLIEEMLDGGYLHG